MTNAPATEVSTLANGLRVASEGSHGETATVGVWIDAGSRYETDKNNGVAHFLEHMAFKGTKLRTQRFLEEEIENMGGHLNAYTSREMTVYYAKVFKSDVGKAMEILSDILLNSRFNLDAIEVERGVILREAEEVSNIQEEVLHDILHETAFQNCGLGRTILGPEKNIHSIRREDLLEYIQTHYTAPRMIICGAGNINHAELCEIASRTFGNLPRNPPKGCIVPSDRGIFTPSEIRQAAEMPLAHIALSFKGLGWTDADAIGLMLLSTFLGSWDRNSSGMIPYIAKDIAPKQLAHKVSTFNTQYKDTGLFGVQISAESQHLPELCKYTIDRLVSLPQNISDEEFTKYKNNLKARIVIELDGTSAICEDIGRQMLTYGRRITPVEAFERINALTPTSFREMCKRLFVGKELAVAGLGILDTLPEYATLKKF